MLNTVSQRTNFLLHVHNECRKVGISTDTGIALCVIRDSACHPSHVAIDMGRPAGYVSGVIDRLAERGLISITNDLRDRRVRNLSVTPAGLRLVEKIITQQQTP